MTGAGSRPGGEAARLRAEDFLALARGHGVLRFGEFTLKSGRVSPYFFDAGAFDDGAAMAHLGRAYAATALDAGIEFDVVFGPAYKGIPLAVATAVALARDFDLDRGLAYNRKEAKDHGEGGRLVGASVEGRVLLVDDVVTAGTAIREVVPLIEAAGGRLTGVVTALDRQERGSDGRSAVAELAAELGAPVLSIATLEDLLGWLDEQGADTERAAVAAYRERYGVLGEHPG